MKARAILPEALELEMKASVSNWCEKCWAGAGGYNGRMFASFDSKRAFGCESGKFRYSQFDRGAKFSGRSIR